MSIFDANALMEHVYKGQIDTEFHTCPIGEYMAQIDPESMKLREVTFKKIEGSGVGLDLMWNILDDNVKKEMNMEKPQARQSMLLDVSNGNKIDFGTNRNMRLKAIIKACDLNTGNFKLSTLKNQVAWVKVEHRADENDPTIIYAEVTRVTSLEKARERQAAQ